MMSHDSAWGMLGEAGKQLSLEIKKGYSKFKCIHFFIFFYFSLDNSLFQL